MRDAEKNSVRKILPEFIVLSYAIGGRGMSGKSLSKIGVKIIVVVSALLIIVAAAITIGFVILFTNAETVNLRDHSCVKCSSE